MKRLMDNPPKKADKPRKKEGSSKQKTSDARNSVYSDPLENITRHDIYLHRILGSEYGQNDFIGRKEEIRHSALELVTYVVLLLLFPAIYMMTRTQISHAYELNSVIREAFMNVPFELNGDESFVWKDVKDLNMLKGFLVDALPDILLPSLQHVNFPQSIRFTMRRVKMENSGDPKFDRYSPKVWKYEEGTTPLYISPEFDDTRNFGVMRQSNVIKVQSSVYTRGIEFSKQNSQKCAPASYADDELTLKDLDEDSIAHKYNITGPLRVVDCEEVCEEFNNDNKVCRCITMTGCTLRADGCTCTFWKMDIKDLTLDQTTKEYTPRRVGAASDTSAYWPRMKSFSYVRDGSGYLNSNGYIVNVGGKYLIDRCEPHVLSDQFAEIMAGGYLDRFTRSLAVDFVAWNPNYAMHSWVQLIFQFRATGGLESSLKVVTLRLEDDAKVLGMRFNGMPKFSFLGDFTYHWMDLAYAVLILCYAILELWWLLKRSIKKYIASVERWFTLVSLLAHTVTVYSWIRFTNSTFDVAEAQPEDLTKQFETKANWHTWFQRAGAVALFLAWLRTLIFLKDRSPRVSVLMDTMINVVSPIFFFLVIVGVIFLGFFIWSNIAFGQRVRAFSTTGSSFITLFSMIFGDVAVYDQLESEYEILGSIHFLLFMLFFFFIILNMNLAVINQAYLEAVRDHFLKTAEIEANESGESKPDRLKRWLPSFIYKWCCKKREAQRLAHITAAAMPDTREEKKDVKYVYAPSPRSKDRGDYSHSSPTIPSSSSSSDTHHKRANVSKKKYNDMMFGKARYLTRSFMSRIPFFRSRFKNEDKKNAPSASPRSPRTGALSSPRSPRTGAFSSAAGRISAEDTSANDTAAVHQANTSNKKEKAGDDDEPLGMKVLYLGFSLAYIISLHIFLRTEDRYKMYEMFQEVLLEPRFTTSDGLEGATFLDVRTYEDVGTFLADVFPKVAYHSSQVPSDNNGTSTSFFPYSLNTYASADNMKQMVIRNWNILIGQTPIRVSTRLFDLDPFQSSSTSLRYLRKDKLTSMEPFEMSTPRNSAFREARYNSEIVDDLDEGKLRQTIDAHFLYRRGVASEPGENACGKSEELRSDKDGANAWVAMLPVDEESSVNGRLKHFDGLMNFQTGFIAVDFVLYNAQAKIFSYVALWFVALPSGGVVPRFKVESAPLELYATGTDMFGAVLQVIYLILTIYYIFEELVDIIKEMTEIHGWGAKLKAIVTHFTADVYNVLDLASYVLSILTIMSFFSVCFGTFRQGYYFLDVPVWDMCKTLPGCGQWCSDSDVIDEFANYTKQFRQLARFASINVVIIFMRVLKFFRYDKTMSVIFSSLSQGMMDIIWFSVMLVLILLAFAHFGHLVFGVNLRPFRDFSESLRFCFQMASGSSSYSDFTGGDEYLEPYFFSAFMIAFYFVIKNIFFAIINKNFQALAKSQDDNPDASDRDGLATVTRGAEINKGLTREKTGIFEESELTCGEKWNSLPQNMRSWAVHEVRGLLTFFRKGLARKQNTIKSARFVIIEEEEQGLKDMVHDERRVLEELFKDTFQNQIYELRNVLEDQQLLAQHILKTEEEKAKKEALRNELRDKYRGLELAVSTFNAEDSDSEDI